MSQAAAQALSQNPDSPERIGQELRDALPTMRLHSLSLHDADGDVVWLSEGVLGPDEHGVVLEAMGAQSLEPEGPIVDRSLGDGRNALILPARTQSGDVVGAAMLIIDAKQSGPALLPKLDTQRVRNALAKLAARHRGRPGARDAGAQPQASPQQASPQASPQASRPPVSIDTPAPARAASESLELTLLPDDPLPAATSAIAPAPTAAAAPKAAAKPAAAARPAPPVLWPSTAGDAAAAPSAAANDKRLVAAAAKLAAAARVPLAKQRIPAPAPPPMPAPRHSPTVRTPRLPASLARSAPAAKPAPAAVEARPSLEGSLISEVSIDLDADGDATVIAPKPEMRDLVLVAQQLLKLRSGGRTRRYEVLLRSRSDPSRDAAPAALMQALTAADATSGIDRYVLVELVQWLGKHHQVWDSDPSSFTINLTSGTLRDRGFLRFASALFEEWKVPPGVVGFEIPERACVEAAADIRSFIDGCEKLGSFIVLDDFSMHSAAVPFLASPSLRLVKIDARLTAAAMKDKLSQAMVIAISQASKVLGVHCVAKRIESSMARQWLSAIGIDFAQGFALERPQTLDSLLRLAPATRTGEPS